jgi:hypothetical protein
VPGDFVIFFQFLIGNICFHEPLTDTEGSHCPAAVSAGLEGCD